MDNPMQHFIQSPIEQLAELLTLPILVYTFVTLREVVPNWSQNKLYDRLLTMLSSIIVTLLFLLLVDPINILSLLLIILIIVTALAMLGLEAKKTTNFIASSKKIGVVIGYSLLISTFFFILANNNSSNETINRLEQVNSEFKSKDSVVLNNIINKIIDDVEKQEYDKNQYNKYIAVILLIISISFIFLFEDKNKEDLSTNQENQEDLPQQIKKRKKSSPNQSRKKKVFLRTNKMKRKKSSNK